MAVIKVWAPKAQKVELENDNKLLPMIRKENDWWEISSESLKHGSNYMFRIDDQGTYPDPRSLWQPEGIEGPSRFYDHNCFGWSDDNFQQVPLDSALIYELHIPTFTEKGTFDSTIDKLDYLKELGVTHVEIMPVNEYSGKHGWGYDGVDLYATHHNYGGPDGLKRLVNACHEKKLAVIMDVVYNHLGPVGNYLDKFGPYFTDKYCTPWGKALNFDGPDSPEVRKFFIDNALMWLKDFHIDALRIDAVHAIVDTSAIHFLEQLTNEVNDLKAQLGKHLYLIAESDLNDVRLIRSQEIGG